MIADAPMSAVQLKQSLERRIWQRTSGRVRSLQVQVDADCVRVHGRADSYYVKQLALVAVRELLESANVELDIRVVSTRS